MDINEREARRKKQREIRQKQIRNHLLILVCMVAAGILTVTLVVNGNDKKESAEAIAAAGAADEAAAGGAADITTNGGAASGTANNTAAGDTADTAAGSAGLGSATGSTPAGSSASNPTSITPTPTTASANGLFDPETGNVTPEQLPQKVADTAAKIPECYTGQLLPATASSGTDRSAEFALQAGVPCGADPVEGEKVVYLTLDDGPSANTITALNILDHYGIKATFFVTGANPEYSYLIKEAYDRGHTIGLHTFSHDYANIYSSVENYYADLNAVGNLVAGQIGFVPCFIRFPGGSSNYISHDYSDGIMTTLTGDVLQKGYQYFDWNASSGDGAETQDPALLADAAVSYDYYDTIVLLSHDGAAKEPTMKALPFIIEYFLSKGYEFRPITRSAYTAHHSVEN